MFVLFEHARGLVPSRHKRHFKVGGEGGRQVGAEERGLPPELLHADHEAGGAGGRLVDVEVDGQERHLLLELDDHQARVGRQLCRE
jgi:hypothetical protein